MHARCRGCHGAIWVETARAEDASCSISCSACGQDYVLTSARRLSTDGDRLADEARRLAAEQAIDLPGALSVVLGLMTLEELRAAMQPPQPGPDLANAQEPPAAQGSAAPYDRAFQPAIDAGLLTAYQARQRGRRNAAAALLARRHDLPIEVAYDIVDNRASLIEGLRRARDAKKTVIELKVPPSPGRRLAWLLAAVSAVASVGLAWRVVEADRPAASTVRPYLRSLVRTDTSGRILEVAAPDPRSVLEGYCAAAAEACTPVETVPSEHPGEARRMGVFHAAGAPTELSMIEIREDRAGERWVAGDGASPVRPRRAPRTLSGKHGES